MASRPASSGDVPYPLFALAGLREEKDAKRRRAAVMSLGYMGLPAAEVVGELEKLQKAIEDNANATEDECWLKTALKKALGRIRDSKAKPVDELMDK